MWKLYQGTLKEYLKGIFTDSNNIFLWHESDDINEKKLISKISFNSNFRFHVWSCGFHCSNRKSRVWDFLWKLLSFHTEMISALWGSVLLDHRSGMDKVRERGAPLPGNDKENWGNRHTGIWRKREEREEEEKKKRRKKRRGRNWGIFRGKGRA